jgi:endo-1,4-beta-mannosidase
MKRSISILLAGIAILAACNKHQAPVRDVWTTEQAHQWYQQWEWLRGSNFIPSTAINQLEMWQADTFDPATIDRELGWAEDIGLNCMRVYLHHLAWEIDPEGFKQRMHDYLRIADNHHIATLFVFFDDCWNPTYATGPQPQPRLGIHNSGWVRDPGERLSTDSLLIHTLETYVKDILNTFRDDPRIVLWDLYNEPGNNDKGDESLSLLKQVFIWGRTVNPSQPLSVGIWNPDLENLNRYQLENSDIITYHNYNARDNHRQAIDTLLRFGRPLICTEYMARRNHSTFQDILPLLKDAGIGAINWGLVDGKTNTKYAWNEPLPDGSEPLLWFHDIFRADGSPYRQEEVDLIRSLTLGETPSASQQ